MRLPEPFPGLVINFAYLWLEEAARGLTEGLKNRPCVVVTAIVENAEGWRVYVAPVTHSSPSNPKEFVEIPHITKKRLGLDDASSWVVLSELNSFIWPGFDLRPIPGRKEWDCVYGVLPPGLFRNIKSAIVERARAKRLQSVKR